MVFLVELGGEVNPSRGKDLNGNDSRWPFLLSMPRSQPSIGAYNFYCLISWTEAHTSRNWIGCEMFRREGGVKYNGTSKMHWMPRFIGTDVRGALLGPRDKWRREIRQSNKWGRYRGPDADLSRVRVVTSNCNEKIFSRGLVIAPAGPEDLKTWIPAVSEFIGISTVADRIGR
ncbi:hypothetical protein C8R44DRAFT_848833, partial [Mycena epipterygia]